MENQNNYQISLEKKKIKKIIFFILIIIISFFLGLFIGVSNISETQNNKNQSGELINKDAKESDYLSKDVDFKLFWETWNTIREKYIDSSNIKDSQIFYGALAGVVASLDDPYSIFLPPEVSKEFNQELEGKFEGIGAEIGIKDEILTIIAPLPNSPAEKAGLKAGDKVLAIDKIDTSQISLNKAVEMIRGSKGTEVILIIKKLNGKEGEVKITRDEIHYESIKVSMTDTKKQKTIDDKNIAYINITHFNQDTESLFDKAVEELLKQNKKSIILDLRNDPGGYLTTAIKVAGYWIENDVIVKEADKNKTEALKSNGPAKLKGKKTIVLVNAGSASAAEIVAGALQDYGVATILGETTFGKGSVQDLTKFKDGSSVKLTIAKWLTPKDRTIDKQGIKPDIEIKMTDDDYNKDRDPQLDKAIELLK